jgi:hypothetical protein
MQARSGLAVIAKPRTPAFFVVEPEPGLTSAQRTRSLAVSQKAPVDAELRQYFAPAPLCALDRAGHGDPRIERAYALCWERTHASVAGEAGMGA